MTWQAYEIKPYTRPASLKPQYCQCHSRIFLFDASNYLAKIFLCNSIERTLTLNVGVPSLRLPASSIQAGMRGLGEVFNSAFPPVTFPSSLLNCKSMKVQLSPYNPDWQNIFSEERDRISKALGSRALRIEHIGSTAVRGLGAKPIIDILLGVNSPDNLEAVIPLMEQLGYKYRSDFEHIMPYRRYFSIAGKFHVHSVDVTSQFFRRHIMFRDYLRTHDDVRDAYYNVKKDLSQKEWDDTNDYAFAKTEFVRSVEAKSIEYISSKIETAEAEALIYIYYNMPPDTMKDCDVKFLRTENYLAMSSGKFPAVILNRVIGLGINKEVTPAETEKIFNFYKNHPHPYNISLSPFAKPENLKDILTENNFITRNSWNKFYRNCEPVPEPDTALRVEEINSKYADAFADIVVNVFKNPPELKPNVSLLVGRKNWYHYLAFHNDLPASAGSMYVHGDTAWFGMATTYTEYRGKSAQSAIIAKRINKAHELGCKWISVETDVHSEEKPNPSYLNMLKYGFNLIYKRPNYVHGKNV
jgi:GrpB-like predicted nucleotidyltransferase (UPF0157 family)